MDPAFNDVIEVREEIVEVGLCELTGGGLD